MSTLLGPALASAAEPVQFNRDIRPILADRCFACHGPDEAAREADLRLDLEEAAKIDLGGYRAIVPGKPDESELILRIESTDEDEVMPPPEKHLTVDAGEKALLRRWIEQGAVWEEHWSFQKLERPEVPEVEGYEWGREFIVIWGGEFGRSTFSQSGKVAESYGRDHHAACFTSLVTGGGFKAGLNYGETDPLCYQVVRDEVTVHDLHATILHQLGLDHEKLTYLFQGRRYRLTDVEGHVVRGLLA